MSPKYWGVRLEKHSQQTRWSYCWLLAWVPGGLPTSWLIVDLGRWPYLGKRSWVGLWTHLWRQPTFLPSVPTSWSGCPHAFGRTRKKIFLLFCLLLQEEVKVKVAQSCPTLCDPTDRLYSSWNSPGENPGVGSLSLLQGIFPIQGSNPGLTCCRQILYQLSHSGGPRILECVAYAFSSRSSWPRNQTRVCCIAGRFFTNWAIREALLKEVDRDLPVSEMTTARRDPDTFSFSSGSACRMAELCSLFHVDSTWDRDPPASRGYLEARPTLVPFSWFSVKMWFCRIVFAQLIQIPPRWVTLRTGVEVSFREQGCGYVFKHHVLSRFTDTRAAMFIVTSMILVSFSQLVQNGRDGVPCCLWDIQVQMSNRSEAERRGLGQRDKCESPEKRSEWRREEAFRLSLEELWHLKFGERGWSKKADETGAVEGESSGTEEGALSLQRGGSGQQGTCLFDCDRMATSDLCHPCLENDGDHGSWLQ